MRKLVLFLIISSFSLLSASVLLWNNENGSWHYPHPETGVPSAGYQGIEEVLNELNVAFEIVQVLPADLSGYSVVFASLGSWCET